MQIIFDSDRNVLGVYTWVDGFKMVPARNLTLEEEVRRYGLAPVIKRLKRQKKWEKVRELLEKFR